MDDFVRFHFDDRDQHKYVLNAFRLFQEKATVPFIARYRRGLTNSASADSLTVWLEFYELYEHIQDRKAKMLQELQRRDVNMRSGSSDSANTFPKKLLTPQLRRDIREAWTNQALDDLWLPFRSVRCTKSEEAEKAGLAPLAESCMRQDCDDMYINDEIKRLRLKVNREKVYDFQKINQGGYKNQGVMILRYDDFGYQRID